MGERPGPRPERNGIRIKIEKAPLHRNLKMAALLAIAALLERGGGAPPSKPRSEGQLRLYAERVVSANEARATLPKTAFERPEFFRAVPRGDFSAAEQAERTQQLPNGETVFRDIGLTFYKVRPGDTVYSIKQRLAAYPEFGHLTAERERLKSFNLPPESLKADMWLPIPLEAKDRQLSDEQFSVYALEAVEQLREHPRYGSYVQQLESTVGDERLTATLLAVAKQESGGKPLGQFELHRYEPHQEAHSYSLFHVLMKGPGLKARRNLDLSEGQLYHPTNATKLFLGFVIEKRVFEQQRSLDGILPLDEHAEQFASFYNGTNWREKNPHYLDNLRRYYTQSRELLTSARQVAQQRAPETPAT